MGKENIPGTKNGTAIVSISAKECFSDKDLEHLSSSKFPSLRELLLGTARPTKPRIESADKAASTSKNTNGPHCEEFNWVIL